MPMIEMVPKQTLSFEEFVRLTEQQRKALGKIIIVPPQLGQPGFGYVVTERPVFATQPSAPSLRRKPVTSR
jgi:hypothetical protein